MPECWDCCYSGSKRGEYLATGTGKAWALQNKLIAERLEWLNEVLVAAVEKRGFTLPFGSLSMNERLTNQLSAVKGSSSALIRCFVIKKATRELFGAHKELTQQAARTRTDLNAGTG